MRKDGSLAIGTTNMRFASDIAVYEYQVYLTDQSHRKRLFIKNWDTYESALKYAQQISAKVNFSIEKYNPTISRLSRSRR